LGSVGIVIAAVIIVPLPLVELSPGPTFDVPALVRFEGHEAQPVNGKILACTVLLGQARLSDVVGAVLRDDHEIVRRREVVPSDISQREYIRFERQLFNESARTGAAVGLRAAGLPVTATGTGARVVTVIDGSPADGRLRVGDVITAVDGKPVGLSSDLVAATAGLPAGRTVTLTVQRDNGPPLQVQLELERVGQLGRPGIGVEVRSVAPRIDLPFPVNVDISDVGGPSAGLMIALSAYDLAVPADVVRGRVVAGTGTIDVHGNVGAVGGVAEKVSAAERDHATVFLAPTAEAREARSAAGRKLQVIEVRTFADAVHALEAP
jgi:PDZ domain-containing protein